MKYCQNCGSPCQDADMVCKTCGCMLEDTGFRPQSNATDQREYTDYVSRSAGSQAEGKNSQPGQTGFAGDRSTQGGNSSTYASQQNQQPYCAYTPNPQTNGMAIASLVLGLVGFLFLWCRGFGLIAAVLAIVFGAISHRSIKQSAGTQTGGGLATAGLVLGIVTIALGIVIGLLILFGLAVSGIFTGMGLSSGRAFNA